MSLTSKTIRQLGFCALIVIIIYSCDPVKSVRVTNLSNNTIKIITDFPYEERAEYPNKEIEDIKWFLHVNNSRDTIQIQIDTVCENLIIKLPPNQGFTLAFYIGSIGSKSEIEPKDLFFSRLSIYTLTDTIKASNKKEIIDLFDNPKTKYNKKTDKKYIYDSKMKGAIHRNIVIR